MSRVVAWVSSAVGPPVLSSGARLARWFKLVRHTPPPGHGLPTDQHTTQRTSHTPTRRDTADHWEHRRRHAGQRVQLEVGGSAGQPPRVPPEQQLQRPRLPRRRAAGPARDLFRMATSDGQPVARVDSTRATEGVRAGPPAPPALGRVALRQARGSVAADETHSTRILPADGQVGTREDAARRGRAGPAGGRLRRPVEAGAPSAELLRIRRQPADAAVGKRHRPPLADEQQPRRAPLADRHGAPAAAHFLLRRRLARAAHGGFESTYPGAGGRAGSRRPTDVGVEDQARARRQLPLVQVEQAGPRAVLLPVPRKRGREEEAMPEEIRQYAHANEARDVTPTLWPSCTIQLLLLNSSACWFACVAVCSVSDVSGSLVSVVSAGRSHESGRVALSQLPPPLPVRQLRASGQRARRGAAPSQEASHVEGVQSGRAAAGGRRHSAVGRAHGQLVRPKQPDVERTVVA